MGPDDSSEIRWSDQQIADQLNGDLGFLGVECTCPVDPFIHDELPEAPGFYRLIRTCGSKEVWSEDHHLVHKLYGKGHFTSGVVAQARNFVSGVDSSDS